MSNITRIQKYKSGNKKLLEMIKRGTFDGNLANVLLTDIDYNEDGFKWKNLLRSQQYILISFNGIYIFIGKDGLEHAFKRRKNNEVTQTSINAAVNIHEYFEDAVLVNELGPRENSEAFGSWILIGAFKNGTTLQIVRIKVDRYTYMLTEVDTLGSLSTKKEDVASNNAWVISPTSSEISVADLLNLVKKYYPRLMIMRFNSV